MRRCRRSLVCIAYCLLPAEHSLLPTAYCLWPTTLCQLPTAYCLLPTVFFVLPEAYCLSHIACCLLRAWAPQQHTTAGASLHADIRTPMLSAARMQHMRYGANVAGIAGVTSVARVARGAAR
jgi:hypothetical protein